MTDPRIEAAARALFLAHPLSNKEVVDACWDLYENEARAALAAADKAAVLVASHHVRRDWANYIETWEGTVGGPVCSPQNIVAALRAKGTPFGMAENERGTE